MTGARSRLTAVQEEWEIRKCLRCRIEADENVAFGSKEPKLQPCGAQGRVQQIRKHGVDENWTVKNETKPDVPRRGSVGGTSVGQCEPVYPFQRMFFFAKTLVTGRKIAEHMHPGKPRV